jgi:hypothetical protein
LVDLFDSFVSSDLSVVPNNQSTNQSINQLVSQWYINRSIDRLLNPQVKMMMAPAQLSVDRAHAGVEEERRIEEQSHAHAHVHHVDPEVNHTYDYEPAPTPSAPTPSANAFPDVQKNIQPMEIDIEKPPTDQEEKDRKSLRTATWVSCFFLITTDILGESHYSICYK